MTGASVFMAKAAPRYIAPLRAAAMAARASECQEWESDVPPSTHTIFFNLEIQVEPPHTFDITLHFLNDVDQFFNSSAFSVFLLKFFLFSFVFVLVFAGFVLLCLLLCLFLCFSLCYALLFSCCCAFFFSIFYRFLWSLRVSCVVAWYILGVVMFSLAAVVNWYVYTWV